MESKSKGKTRVRKLISNFGFGHHLFESVGNEGDGNSKIPGDESNPKHQKIESASLHYFFSF
jgi:hypothetical protein